jgi:hypothetical protein
MKNKELLQNSKLILSKETLSQKGYFYENLILFFQEESPDITTEEIDKNISMLINSTKYPWIFRSVFESIFPPIQKTTDIELWVDGKLKHSGDNTWTKFLLNSSKIVGLDICNKVYDNHIISTNINDVSKLKNGKSKSNKIHNIGKYFINQQGLAGTSQHSYQIFMDKLNSYFGYKKIHINPITNIIYPEFKKYYK